MALILLFLLGSVLSEPDYNSIPDKDDLAVKEEVESLLRHPLDLNRVRAEDLLAIPWLCPLLAYRIISFRDSVGGFNSLSALRSVPGVTEEVYRSLLPVVILNQKDSVWSGDIMLRTVVDVDTSPVCARRVRSFVRARLEQGSWLASVVLEKDRGETNWSDWFGTGLQYAASGWKAIIGDFSVGSGLGLVLSGPYRRAAAGWTGEAVGPSGLRLVGVSLESRNLRGVGADFSGGNWRGLAFISVVGRDARLNPDGTVRKLIFSGLHDDSAAIASRNSVQEASVGLDLARAWRNLRFGTAAYGVKYSRSFAAIDSTNSFFGTTLGSVGVHFTAKTGAYLLGGEAGFSSGGGGAGAVDVSGIWRNWSVEWKAAGYDRRYFAPLSCWRTLTDRRSRLTSNGRLGYRAGRFSLSVRGNTYRDYELDSLPARLEACFAVKSIGFSAELRLGRSYRLEQERLRTARFIAVFAPFRQGEVRLMFADAYPDRSLGRGNMFGMMARTEQNGFWLNFTAARFDISGMGIRMFMSEYGPLRSGSTFSTSSSAWRAGLGGGFRFTKSTGLGFKIGCTYKSNLEFEFGMQAEVGMSS